MRRSEGVALRIPPQMREAIEDLGRRLGTDNVSEIIRAGFMSGYREINQLPEQLTRQGYQEGVFRGLAAFKPNLEKAIAETLEDYPA